MKKSRLDTLLVNGKIHTMREEGEFFESVGFLDGRIAFVGTNKEARELTASQTIDLAGKTAIPGMTDSHLHMYAYCKNQTAVDLETVRSIADLLAVMARKAAATEKGKWIKGAGFDQTKFVENRFPTREEMDLISTEHPIVIRRCCLHVMIANSAAMQKAGVNAEVIARYDGLIETDDNGEPTGIFREKSTILFDEIVPDPLSDPEERGKILANVLSDMAAKGLTAIHTYAAKIWNYEESKETYLALQKAGKLPLRVVVSLDELFENDSSTLTRISVKNPYDKVKYGSYKIFTDGSLGARSAALFEPYSDAPDSAGIQPDQDKIFRELLTACEHGLQPAIHAIGDKALEVTLNAIEAVLEHAKKHPPGKDFSRLPFRIIHAQLVTPVQLERMKRLPVVLDIQPVFLCTDLYWIESRIGPERLKNAYLWKTLYDAGLMMAGGSDCPVESYDPFKGVYAAVTRQDLNGFPENGFCPEEKLTVYEALSLFTKNAAYLTGDQDVLGTIENGKFADLVVLDRDPFTSAPEELKDINVLMTFVAGEKVYEVSE